MAESPDAVLHYRAKILPFYQDYLRPRVSPSCATVSFPSLLKKIELSTKSISVVLLLKPRIGIRELNVPNLHISTTPTLSAVAFLDAPPFSGYPNSDGIHALSLLPVVNGIFIPQRM